MKKTLIWALVLCLLTGLFAFTALADDAEEAAAEEEENYETGDASLDNPRNQDEIGDKELLIVSFGTSYNDSRRLTIGAIEEAMEAAFPEWSVRRAFTSQIIIDHVLSRDGEKIDNVTEALERAAENGVKELVVQPTHLMSGFEFNDLRGELAEWSDAFESIRLGKPILSSEEDFASMIEIMTAISEPYMDGKTAFVFMGHGTEAESNEVYAELQSLLDESGVTDRFVGTVEAEPSLDDVMEMVEAGSYERVVLRPLMIVAGDHANNDMAGDEEDSWKSSFEAAGYEVDCVLEGLGQLESVRAILVAHAADAVGD